LLETDKQMNPAKIVFDNAESIAVVSAVVLYFKEIPERKKQKHYEAWQVIDNAKGIETSYARRKALEDLYEDDVSFRGIDLPEADLQNINLRWSNFSESNLRGANLRGANFTLVTLCGANLSGADLRWADLSGADLRWADLSGANLVGTILSGANLINAKLCDGHFYMADLSNIKWSYVTQWPDPAEVATDQNIPEALRQQLEITAPPPIQLPAPIQLSKP
jgi:hypothetical protein